MFQFVLRQPTAGWSSDLLNILDAPPAMAGCVPASQILLVPSDDIPSATDITRKPTEGLLCMDKFVVPCDDPSDSSSWIYPSVQYQKWESKKLLDELSAPTDNTSLEVGRTGLTSSETKNESKTSTSRKKGLPPTGGASSSSRKPDKAVETAVVHSEIKKTPLSIMTAIRDNCTGLGNVCEASLDPKYQYDDVNCELIAQFGLTDRFVFSPPTEGTPDFTLPPSRGRTPPVPPGATHLSDSTSSVTPKEPFIWAAGDSNSFIPTLFGRL